MSDKIFIGNYYRDCGVTKIIPDTNIWTMLYGAEAVSLKKSKAWGKAPYDTFIKTFKGDGHQILTHTLILQEYYNHAINHARILYNKSNKTSLDKKNYRLTADFQTQNNAPITELETILRTCDDVIVTTSEDLNATQALLKDVGKGQMDYLDLLIESVAIKAGAYILTHDKDFKFSKAGILSYHPDITPRKST